MEYVKLGNTDLTDPHAIVGVMAQNKPTSASKEHVWLANAKYLADEKQRRG